MARPSWTLPQRRRSQSSQVRLHPLNILKELILIANNLVVPAGSALHEFLVYDEVKEKARRAKMKERSGR